MSSVALLMEGVDRNKTRLGSPNLTSLVALLMEGVDRNCKNSTRRSAYQVALLMEGVDRNYVKEAE